MPKKILFVCTGNSCRSVMAEGLFKKIMASRSTEFEARSAGVGAIGGFPATSETIRVMKEEEGVDVSQHRSQRLTVEMVQSSDRIYVMEKIHQEWVLRLEPLAQDKLHLLGDSDIPDPIRMSYDFYKNVLTVIRHSLKKITEEL